MVLCTSTTSIPNSTMESKKGSAESQSSNSFDDLGAGVDKIQKECGSRGGKIINGVVACSISKNLKEADIGVNSSEIKTKNITTDKLSDKNLKTEKEVKLEMANDTLHSCLDDDSMKKQIPDTSLRKKMCEKIVNGIVENYITGKCKKTSPDSDLVKCEDGTTYKKVATPEKDDNGHLAGAPSISDKIIDISRYVEKKSTSATDGVQVINPDGKEK